MSPSELGLSISRVFRRTAPDPIVLAIGLTALTAVLVLVWGRFDEGESRFLVLLDAWRADSGIWKFLAFGMQMCLILITGHALASTRPVRRVIDRLAGLPRSTASAACVVAFVAALTGVVNWGLGLIVGALLAREVGRALERRGIAAHYPLMCAAGYMGLLVWHGGLSGSAPLSMTTITGAAKVLPAEWVEARAAANVAAGRPEDLGIPLGRTIGSPMNLFVTGGPLVGVPLLLVVLAPRRAGDLEPIGRFRVVEDRTPEDTEPATGLPDRLGRSPFIAGFLALLLLAAVARYVATKGIGSIDLNTINATMLAAGLFLHGSPVGYMKAATDGARGCAGIMVQFPLYAGIMAMMVASGLVERMAEGIAAAGNEHTIPLLSFLAAGVVNLFVPSGGGQWGIQGPVALEAGLQAGIAPGKMIMAVAYGDQLTNMLQPFWALPLLAITGARARDIVGYTAIVMVIAGGWMTLGLLLF